MTIRSSSPVTRRDLGLALLGVLLLFLAWALRTILMLIAFAMLFAFILDPLVSALERPAFRGRHLPRGMAAVIVILALVVLIGSIASIGMPLLVRQLVEFAGRLPGQIERIMDELRTRAAGTGWAAEVDPAFEALRSMLPQAGSLLMRGVAGLFARFDQLIGLAVLPVLTFYLLADSKRVRESMLRFLPEHARAAATASADPVRRALRSYVRGQALVCLTMGTATGTVLAIAHIPNALLLGVLAGVGEIVPFLGASCAATAIVLSGWTLDLGHAVLGLVLYLLNNWMLGTFVTPRVMSRYLELHPFAVIVSVLAGVKLLGPPGAILALPAAAVVQALVEDMASSRRADAA